MVFQTIDFVYVCQTIEWLAISAIVLYQKNKTIEQLYIINQNQGLAAKKYRFKCMETTIAYYIAILLLFKVIFMVIQLKYFLQCTDLANLDENFFMGALYVRTISDINMGVLMFLAYAWITFKYSYYEHCKLRQPTLVYFILLNLSIFTAMVLFRNEMSVE
jgi:hypothetical protein